MPDRASVSWRQRAANITQTLASSMSAHTCCFGAAARLTRHAESRALGRELVEFLGSLPGVSEIRIQEIAPTQSKLDFAQFHPDLYVVRELGDHAAIAAPPWLDSLDGESLRFPTARRHGENTYVIPLGEVAGSLRFVQLTAGLCDGDTLEICQYAAEIFGNQLRMLSHFSCDPLTGLLNRQTFEQELLSVMDGIRHALRNPEANRQAWLAILDVDHFKRINDGFGHLIGDEILILLANLIRESFRQGDLPFRYGGEEFIVLLMEADRDGAMAALERFRSVVEQHEFPIVGQVTVSIGCADIRPDEPPTSLADRADKALYEAKNNGRNQVVAYDSLAATNEPRPATENALELFD